MIAMIQMVIDEVYTFAASMWVELFFVTCFAFGFAALRVSQVKKKSSKIQPKLAQVFKPVHTQASSGNAAKAVAAWRATKTQQLTPCDTIRVLVQAYLDSDPSALIDDLTEHFSRHSSDSGILKAVVAALEVVARAGNEKLMDGVYQSFVDRLRIPATLQLQEILLGGYAAGGNEMKVRTLMEQLRRTKQKITVRGYSLMMKGFLKNDRLDIALTIFEEMRTHGMTTPASTVPELLRVARISGRAVDVFRSIADKDFIMSSATVTSVLEDCLKSQDTPLAKCLEQCARDYDVQLNFAGHDLLLKIYAGVGDLRAIELFDEVQKAFPHINEGICVGLLARCAEPKFLRFAEQIFEFLRSRGQMTIIVFSAMMKVYSYCGMYDKACDLYDQLKAEGFEPDSMMYGCLMKFSAECGRTDLTRELSSKMPNKKFGNHHYMSLIRAAGQDKDVGKAFAVLEQFSEAGGRDTVMCNAVIDVCSAAGDMNRAWRLLAEMKKDSLADIISYNTLLKGYCTLGDTRAANDVVAEMQKAGLQPNDVSYNCLINLAASAGDSRTAWRTIQTMESKGIRIDHYTVSTLLKALKQNPNGKDDISKVLDLLDRHQIDVCCEEVLLNTALDACMKHGEHRRLEGLLDKMKAKPGMQLASHTYASLIKATGTLKNVERCRQLWQQMTEERGILPTDVALGCMMDALVCNKAVSESVALFRKWQDRVPLNTVLYSTLIKGFNNIGDAKGAVAMWNELRTKNLPMNTTVYNAMIDVHARLGATREVSSLLNLMAADGLQPDNITQSIVAKASCVSGDLDNAMNVFRNLPVKSFSNNVIIYNTILDGCVRHNRMELADDMLLKMEDYGITPTNFTLGIIVKMWGRRRILQEAFVALESIPKKYGFKPNGPVKTCLFFACIRNDATEAAAAILEELRTQYHVDAKMFSALISNCARVGQSERAVALVEEAYGLGKGKRALPQNEDLDSSCMELLMKCLAKQGHLQTMAKPLLTKMEGAKIYISKQVWALSTQGPASR
jgi:pentatricopeptide repeat protein